MTHSRQCVSSLLTQIISGSGRNYFKVDTIYPYLPMQGTCYDRYCMLLPIDKIRYMIHLLGIIGTYPFIYSAVSSTYIMSNVNIDIQYQYFEQDIAQSISSVTWINKDLDRIYTETEHNTNIRIWCIQYKMKFRIAVRHLKISFLLINLFHLSLIYLFYLYISFYYIIAQ